MILKQLQSEITHRSAGREFHDAGPACENERLPNLLDFVLFMRQVSYQVGCREIVKHTVTELWNHFIDLRACRESGWIQRTSDKSDLTLTFPRSVGVMTELNPLSLIVVVERTD